MDSSGWLAFFTNEPNAHHFREALKDPESLVVPAITIFEVFRVMKRELGEQAAMAAANAMEQGLVVEMTARMAIKAAKLSLEHSLPMADSIILATAQLYDATIWTQDAHFKSIAGVKFFAKK